MVMSSNVANAASRGATTGSYSNSQFGPDTPWARTVAGLPSTPATNNNVINTTGNEPTFSSPMMRQDPVTGQWYGTVQQAQEAARARIAAENKPAPWTLEGDALYQAALAAGKSAFSFSQAQALADKQNQETAANQQRKSLDTNATESRRRLAGNYAARGMAGGAAGALSMAEARANAEQVAARTTITDQLTALNNQYLQNYGDSSAKNYDWTGTLAGQQYKTQAAQAAVQAQLARYGAA